MTASKEKYKKFNEKNPSISSSLKLYMVELYIVISLNQ